LVRGITFLSRPFRLLLIGIVGGLLAEALLLLGVHCARAERELADDFRVIAFLSPDLDESARGVVLEHLLSLPGTAVADYLSPDEILRRVEDSAPDVAASVAALGGNPLSGAFEVGFEPGDMGLLPGWLKSAGAIDGVDELMFRSVQAATILQLGFYSRFLRLLLSLAAVLTALLAAVLLVIRRRFCGPRDVLTPCAVGAAGAAAGAGVALLLALPLASELGSVRPGIPAQAALLLFGALLGWAAEDPGAGASSGRPSPSARKPRSRRAASAAAALLLCGASAQAATLGAKQRELNEVKKSLKTQREQVERFQEQRKRAEAGLFQLKKTSGKVRRQVQELEKERTRKETKSRELGQRLGALEAARDRSRDVLEQGLSQRVRGVLLGEDIKAGEELWETACRRAALRENTLMVAKLSSVHAATSIKHAGISADAKRLRDGVLRKRSELQKKERSMNAAKRTLTKASKGLEAARARLKELEDSAGALEELVQRLRVRRRGKGKTQSKQPPVARHSLPWPASGPVLTAFGKRRVKELDTWTIQNGIEIAAKGGAVRPVESGEVAFAGPFRSYGTVIIIDHGSGFFSIYGRLGEVLKKKGDRVKAVTRIATAGKSLYFELRQAGRALNPVMWLKKR